MYTKRGFIQGILVMSVAALLCGTVLADEESQQTSSQQAQATQQRLQATSPGGGMPTSGMLQRTSKLIGKQVKNAQNEDLGSIYDFVLASDHQRVSYVALSSGGAWGMGAKYYAAPWSTIQVGSRGDVTTSISKQHLEQMAGFDKNNWPAQANMQLTSMMGQAPSRMGTGMETSATGVDAAASNRAVQCRRVSHLTGTSIRNGEGEDIGNIEDFVIDASHGQVAYAVISFGGVWGIGEKFAAVPSTALDIQPWRHTARLDASKSTLERIAFEPSKFPDLSNREYAQQLHQAFNAEPYWTVLGYIPSEQDQAMMYKAWGKDGRFAKLFDAKNVTTIQGTVQSVGNFQPEGASPGTPGGLRIRLTTDEGNMVTIYSGPQWYAQQHDFHIKPGDRLSVTGSQARIGWRSVLVASQIKAGSRTLPFRNESGQPLWSEQPGSQQEHQTDD